MCSKTLPSQIQYIVYDLGININEKSILTNNHLVRDSITRLKNIMANPGYEEKSSVEEEGNVISLVDYSYSSDDESESPTTSIKERRLSDSELNASLSHDATEEESHAAPVKKPRLSDSGLNTSLSHNASEDESLAAPMKKRRLSDPELNISLSHDDDESPAAPMKKRCLSDSELNTSLSHDGFSNFDAKEEIKMEASSQSKPRFDDTFSESELDDDEDWDTFNTDSDLLNWGRYSGRRGDRWNQREEYFINLANSPREETKCVELLDEIGCGHRFLGCSVEMGRGFFAQLNKEEAARMRGLEEIREVIEFRFCVFDIS